MCRHTMVLVMAAASLAAAPATARAARMRVPARADTYVDATRPHHVFGHRRVLRVSSSPRRRTYLRFAVPRVGSRPIRARLRLSVDRGAGRLEVRRLSARSSWSERRTTFARAARAVGRAIRSRALQRGRVVIDVTQLVRLGRPANLELSGGRDIRLWSRETARAPVLAVDPAAAPPAPPAPPAPAAPAAPAVPSPPPPDPVVAAAGDIACAPANPSFNGGLGTPTACAQKRTSDLLAGAGLAAVLALGDNQYDSGTLAEYTASFDATWGRVKPILHPVAGNHEYVTTGADGYFDYFNGAGAATGPAGRRGLGYYSFDLGAWHLVALNSNCAAVPGGCGAGSPQEQWLAADLSAHPATCTLAYWHHPRWSSGADVGNDGELSALWNDLYAAGAEVVLSGHGHLYERFAPQAATTAGQPAGTLDPARGLREFVVGTGGEDHAEAGAVQPNSEVRDDNTFGVLELALHPGSYAWRFVPEAGGTFSDSGTAPCH
jgi:acid phosphatase type 7